MPRRRGLHVRQAGKTVLKILAAVSAETRPFSLLTAESIMLGVRHEKEGKLRVTYAGWDDAEVVLNGHVFRRNGAIRFPSPLSSHPPRKTGGGCAHRRGSWRFRESCLPAS